MAGFVTDKTVRALVAESRARGERVEQPHPEAEGLRVRVRARGDGEGFTATWVWYGPRGADGKRKLHDLGSFPAVSAKEAAAKLGALKLDHERLQAGLAPALPAPSATPMRLSALIARFVAEDLRDRRDLDAPKRLLDVRVLGVLGDVEVRAIRDVDVMAVVERVKADGHHTQARKLFALVKQMFTFAALPTVRAVERSPAENLTERVFRFRRSERRERLAPEELGDLWRVVRGKPRDPRAATSNLALLILLGTARRTGELVHARWGDVDLDAGLWRVPKGNRKATRALEQRMPDTDRVALPPQVLRAFARLRALAPESPWVLATPKHSASGHIGETTLARALADMRKAGLVNVTSRLASPHAFRHAFKATAEEQRWASTVALELALGHVLPGIFGTYTLADFDDERARALARWCDYLDALAGFGGERVVNLDAARRGQAGGAA